MVTSLARWWRSRASAENQAKLEAEMEEEMRFHMMMEERHLASRGATLDEARRRARISFGAEEQFKEEIRHAMPLRWLSDLRTDIAYALRSLRRSPGFTAFAVIALGIGIGANATAFGFTDPIAFRKLPIPDPDRLVAVYSPQADETLANISYQDFENLKRRVHAFEDGAAFTEHPVSLTIDGAPSVVYAVQTSDSYFSVLGLTPEHGRFFQPGDRDTQVAVIGHKLWTSRFKSDPRIVGKRVSINGSSVTIIGVAPESFHGTRLLTYEPALWIPIGSTARGVFIVIARLTSDATIDEAQREAGPNFTILSNSSPINPWLASRSRIELIGRLCLLGVCVVLLVACADVANLLLTRMSVRRQEIATRIALGVSASRLARQLLVESFVLVLLGAIISIPLAFVALKAANRLTPPLDFETTFHPSLDARVIAFTAGISLLSAFVFGMAPLIQLWWRDLNPDRHNSLRAAGGSGAGFRSALVVMQVALSVVAIAAAGLLYRALDSARSIDLGFDTKNAVVFTVDPLRGAAFDARRVQAFTAQLKQSLATIPGVSAVSLASSVPLDGETLGLNVFAADDPHEFATDQFIVDNNHFTTLGIRIAEGRTFKADDSTSLEPVVINGALARRMTAARSPIGAQLKLARANGKPAVVVGVARFNASRRLGDTQRLIIWRPMERVLVSRITVVMRSNRDVTSLQRDVHTSLQSIDPAIPLVGFRSLEDRVALAYTSARTGALAGVVFGTLTTILAAFGLFGVLLYNITQRTREIGVRRALGASTGDVLRMITASSVRLTLIGTAIGMAIVLLIPPEMSAVLYGASPRDPQLLVITPVAFLLIAILATVGPAWKAIRIEPIEALRVE